MLPSHTSFGSKKSLAKTMLRIGPRSLSQYGLHKLRLRNGFYAKKTPLLSWDSVQRVRVEDCRSPFSPPDLDLVKEKQLDPEGAIATGERILNREWLYFSDTWMRIPDSWRANPTTGAEVPLGHWTKLSESNPLIGDIKWIWETSRFDWVFALARAWAASGDEKFVEGFWQLLEDWRENNPPNCSINWRCGQETSLRLMALIWAAGVFRECASSTEERLHMLWNMVAVLAERVSVSLGYAKSQGNNHALAESAGVLLAGLCLSTHDMAQYWVAKGMRLHFEQLQKQFFKDGSYSMHSLNYQRVAMRDAFIVLYSLRSFGVELPASAFEGLKEAPKFLGSMICRENGIVPNYGANDGTNIWNLNGAPFEDFRPVINTLEFLLNGKRVYGGATEEELAWHFGAEAFQAEQVTPAVKDVSAGHGGYYGAHSNGTFGFFRCHAYRTRPLQSDMLHFDLSVGGVPVLVDSGSYQYNDSKGWGEYFDSSLAHNTINIDGKSQMSRGGRFLWLDWVQGELIEDTTTQDGFRKFVGECSPASGVSHRRTIYSKEGRWLIVDDVAASAQHLINLRWHLAGNWVAEEEGLPLTEDPDFRQMTTLRNGTLCVTIRSDSAAVEEILTGSDAYPQAAHSPHYGFLQPCTLYSATANAQRIRFVTEVLQAGDSGAIWPDLEASKL